MIIFVILFGKYMYSTIMYSRFYDLTIFLSVENDGNLFLLFTMFIKAVQPLL